MRAARLDVLGVAIRLDIERLVKRRHLRGDLARRHVTPERSQLLHLEDLDVAAERGAVAGEIGVDVEHPAVVVAHQAKPVVREHVHGASGGDPVVHLSPARLVVVQETGHLVKVDVRPPEDTGNLGDRACRAMREPFAGHGRAIPHRVDTRVVDRGSRLEVQHHNRHPRPPDRRQHRGAERIRGDVEKDQIDIFGAKPMPRIQRLRRRVDQAEIDDVHAGTTEPFGHDLHISVEA